MKYSYPVCKLSHQLTGTKAERMTEAHRIVREVISLIKAMQLNFVSFLFVNKDGEYRPAIGTAFEGTEIKESKVGRFYVRFIDGKKGEYRCFNLHNFVRVENVNRATLAA